MRAVAVLLGVLVLAACTPDEREDTAYTGPSSSADTATESPPAPATTSTTRPLVLATNPRRGPIDVSAEVARRVIDGTVRNWRVLGEPPAPLTVDDSNPARNLPMNTIAVGVADGVGPGVRVIEVDGVDPLRDPDDYPVQVQGPAHAPVTTMTIVGDIMLGRRVGGGAALRPMQGRLASVDITVGNLENTLARLGPPNPVQTNPSYAPPSVRADLRRAGFDALSLANNHTGDYGDASLVRTAELLRAGRIDAFGAGPDLAAAREPTVLRRHGTSFGFLGFNAIGETAEAGPGEPGALSVSMPPRTGPLDRAELDRVLGDVRRLAQRVDVVVVMPHWGEQYTNEPWPEQVLVGRRLAEAGADLVVGGHPHWVQGASMVGDTLVVNSLGNFVFDMDDPAFFTPDTMEGLVLEATFWGDRLMAADFVPYRIGGDYAPRVVARADADRIYDRFWEFSGLGATR